jgi:peptidylprolyl isomerase
MTITRIVTLLTLLAAPGLGTAPAHAADPAPAPSASASPAAQEKPTVTKSGLEYIDVKVGTGATPKAGDTVRITYTINVGAKAIETRTAGQPFEFQVGRGQALKGLDEGVSTMKAGGQRKLMVPPSLGYGAEAVGSVPPNSPLLIDVELLEVR